MDKNEALPARHKSQSELRSFLENATKDIPKLSPEDLVGTEYKLKTDLKLVEKDVDYIVGKVRETNEVIAIVEKVLQKYPGASRTVVENFLTSSEGKEWDDQKRSLQLDTQVYLRDPDTFEAINVGLIMMMKAGLLRNDR